MKPRLSVLTIAVDDLERSLRFYRDGLGLPTEGIIGGEFEHGAVAFFNLQGGLKLAIWPRTSLTHDLRLATETETESAADGETNTNARANANVPTLGRPAFSLGHNVASRDEVDAVMEQAERAGARILKPAQETFWGGYAGYFQDPDGHLWEVVWNPDLLPSD
jgi:catechol 2,3-dioxygenase-like lactoylglutathione lyase family enzyme